MHGRCGSGEVWVSTCLNPSLRNVRGLEWLAFFSPLYHNPSRGNFLALCIRIRETFHLPILLVGMFVCLASSKQAIFKYLRLWHSDAINGLFPCMVRGYLNLLQKCLRFKSFKGHFSLFTQAPS